MRFPVQTSMNTVIIVSFTFGYCDTITFYTSGFFSVHVAANIIFSACQFLRGHALQGLLQLCTIPVSLAAVFLARRVFLQGAPALSLIKTGGIMLMATGLLSALLTTADLAGHTFICLMLAFLVVLAMGSIVPGFWVQALRFSQQGVWLLAGGFITGCVSGALAGSFVGLSGVMLPGVLLFLFTMND